MAVTLDVIVEALKDDKKVILPGLGTITPKIRAARVYTNPKTGAPVPRPALTYLAWKTASTLKGNLTVPPTTPAPAPSPAPVPAPDPAAPVAQ